jgi:hypothetical protein
VQRPDYIIAGYADGALSLLRSVEDQYIRVAERTSEDYSFGGDSCRMYLVDLDRTGRKEIAIFFYGSSPILGHADWYFRWENDQLENIGPVIESIGPPETGLHMSGLLDLDHDGIPEVVSNGPDHDDPVEGVASEERIPPPHVFKLYEGKLIRADTTLTLAERFFHEPLQQGGISESEQTFGFGRLPTGAFRLKVINGEFDGTHRVSAARIVLNGITLVSPHHVTDQVEFFTVKTMLKQKNELKVQLKGPPGSWITVTIEPLPPPVK